MNTWIKRTGLVVLVVALVVGVVGTAAAQGPGEDGRPRHGRGAYLQWRFDAPLDRALQAVLTALRDATGLTWDDVAVEVRGGKTLSAIITENGMDPDAIAEQVVADLTAQVEEAVADGTISEERAQVVIANLPDAVERVMNASRPLTPVRDRIADWVAQGVDVSLAGVLAEMTGMEPIDLLRDVLTPPTLSEIAEELGLDPDAALAEAEARITARVNAALEDGWLTEEQAAQVLDGLAERLEERMESSLGRFGVGPGGRIPWRPGRMLQESPIA